MTTATTTHTVVIIGVGPIAGRWGKGDDLAAAKKRFRSEGGIFSKGYSILRFEEGSEFEGVDAMGYTHWTGTEPTVEEVAPSR